MRYVQHIPAGSRYDDRVDTREGPGFWIKFAAANALCVLLVVLLLFF